MIAAEVKYKKTGINWMSEIPEYWEVRRLKNVCRFLYGNTLKAQDRNENGNVDVFGSNGFVGKHDMAITEEPCIIIGRKGSFGKINLSETKCFPIDTTYYVDKTVTNENIYWVYYLLQCLKLDAYSKDSAVPGLGREEAYVKLVPVPPIDEQIEIVNYIQNESTQIDNFIQTKQRFIELLKEQRQSIIDESLNIDTKQVRLKFCVSKVGSGITPKGGASVYQTSGIFFLRSQNIHDDGLRLDDVAYISNKIHKKMHGSQVKKGDVLLNITGASIGRCFWFNLDEEANVNQHVSIVRPINEVIDSEFLMYQIQSQRIQNLINIAQGASREGLTIQEIKNYHLVLPKIEEQKQIVKLIKTETRTLDIAISKAEREIELIKEYREAMIAEAVTGKAKIC